MKLVSKIFLAGLVSLAGFAITASAKVQAQQSLALEPTRIVAPTLPQEFNLGTVELDVVFNLNSRGEPVNIRVNNSPSFSYAKSALRAVDQWRFRVDEDLDLSNTDIRLPIVFSYDNGIG